MCRKVKDIKCEDINRLKEKYKHVLSGKVELNVHKISNFVNLVIPTLAEQFKDQSRVRYFCMFSNCIPHKRSYQTKQKYIQHLFLKHSNMLPGKGIFLLNTDNNIRANGFWCSKCGRNFKRKDHLNNHLKNVIKCFNGKVLDYDPGIKKIKIQETKKNAPQNSVEPELIVLEETLTQCSLVDFSLNIEDKNNNSIICLD